MKLIAKSANMIKRVSLVRFHLTVVISVYAQDLDIFLKQVSASTPELLAYKKLLVARRIEARTGLTPADPFVSFGYMPGNRSDLGI
jgi:hypothetical protein